MNKLDKTMYSVEKLSYDGGLESNNVSSNLKPSRVSLDVETITFYMNGVAIELDETKFPKFLDNTEYIEINGIAFRRMN